MKARPFFLVCCLLTSFAFTSQSVSEPYEGLPVKRITVEIENQSPGNQDESPSILHQMETKVEGKFDQEIFDKDLNVIYSDPTAFEEVLGTPRTVSPADFEYWLSLVHPDDREEQRSYLEKRDFPLLREYRIIHPKKGLRWIRTSNSQYMDNYVSFSEDVTDEKL